MKHTIGIALYGKSDYIKACLASIARNTTVEHEVCIADTKEPRISLAAGWNKALRMGTGEFCTVLNDDVLLSPGWLDKLEQALLEDPKRGTVSPTLSRCASPQREPYRKLSNNAQTTTLDQTAVDALGAQIAHDYAGQKKKLRWVCGCCLTFRRTVFEELGGFDEEFFPMYGEDDDWCDRVIEAGLQCVWVMDSFVHHFGGKTASRIPDLARADAHARLAMKRKARAAK